MWNVDIATNLYIPFLWNISGRLHFSSVDGKEADGRHSSLYTYGGRSFSIWKESDLSLVYDSGDDIEQRIARHFPHAFNADGKALKKTPEESRDSRSHIKVDALPLIPLKL